MKIYCIVFLLLLGFGLALGSCKDGKEKCQDANNPDCENYNPCLNTKETSAEFTMEERITGASTDGFPSSHVLLYDTDTCLSYNDIVITCKQKTDSVWWIYDDTERIPSIQQKRQFTQKFRLVDTNPGRIKVTCIVKNNKPNPCIPNDNGMDTFTRYIGLMPTLRVGWQGTYWGSLQSNPDSMFKVNLRIDSVIWGSNKFVSVHFDELLIEKPFSDPIHGVPPGAEYGLKVSRGYYGTYLIFNAAGGSGIDPSYKGQSIRGVALYNPKTNAIRIEYTRFGKNSPYIGEWPPIGQQLHIFTGTKIK